MSSLRGFGIWRLLAAGVLMVQFIGIASAAEQAPSRGERMALRSALGQFSGEATGQRSSGPWYDALTTKGIIIVNSRPGATRSPRARLNEKSGIVPCTRPGARSGPSLTARGIIIVNSRPGMAASQRNLMRSIQRFEQAAGANSRLVRACRARESRCMQQCRSVMSRQRLQGECSCIGVRAHCLGSADPAHPPEPV